MDIALNTSCSVIIPISFLSSITISSTVSSAGENITQGIKSGFTTSFYALVNVNTLFLKFSISFESTVFDNDGDEYYINLVFGNAPFNRFVKIPTNSTAVDNQNIIDYTDLNSVIYRAKFNQGTNIITVSGNTLNGSLYDFDNGTNNKPMSFDMFCEIE